MNADATPVDELVGTEPEALPPGTYVAELVAIEKTSTSYGERLRWRFVVPDHDNFEVSGWTSLNVSPQSKAGAWVAAIRGQGLARGERAPLSELVDRAVTIVLAINPESGYNKLEDVTRTAPGIVQAAAAASQAAAVQDPDYAAWLAERQRHAAEAAGERLPEQGEPLPGYTA